MTEAQRHIKDLPETVWRILLDVLVEQGMIDAQGYITPLGEEYIAAGDTQPVEPIRETMKDGNNEQ